MLPVMMKSSANRMKLTRGSFPPREGRGFFAGNFSFKSRSNPSNAQLASVVSQLGHSVSRHGKITEAGVQRRAEHYYQQLDVLRLLRQDLLVESKKHKARKLLREIPGIGPIRAALLIALMQTPHRFRTKRQLWNYSGLGLETHDSAQYRVLEGTAATLQETCDTARSQ